jgi:hypothetical protein
VIVGRVRGDLVATLAYGSASHALRPRVDDSGTGSTKLSFYRSGTPSIPSRLRFALCCSPSIWIRS